MSEKSDRLQDESVKFMTKINKSTIFAEQIIKIIERIITDKFNKYEGDTAFISAFVSVMLYDLKENNITLTDDIVNYEFGDDLDSQ